MHTLDFTPLYPPRLEKVPVEKLKSAPVGDRFRPRAHLKEFDHLHEINLQALHHVESDMFYITTGVTVFVTGREHGIQEFACEIVGEIEHLDQAIWARLHHVFERHRPFHILEQTRCIHDAGEKLRRHFGPDKFNGHGGDRRSPDNEKLSIVRAVGQRLPFVESRIGILLRLAGHLGPWGLEGLYLILKTEKRKLTIGRINARNAKLKRQKFRARIEDVVQEMADACMTGEEILSRVGALAYAALFEKEPKEELPNVEPEDGGKEPEIGAATGAADDGSGSGKKSKEEPNRGIYQPIPAQARAEIFSAYMELYAKLSEKMGFLRTSGDMTSIEAEEICAWTEEIQTMWTTYKITLLRHGQLRPPKP